MRFRIIQKVLLPLTLPNKNNLDEFSYGVTGFDPVSVNCSDGRTV